jgi:CPA1 family monovalent cation:H+ antiporter
MRGVVTVAAVQTIPAGTPHRATVVLAAFVVALITLVMFGISLPAVIARMRFRPESAEDKRDSVQELMRQIGEAAIDAVGPLEEQTVDGEPLDPDAVRILMDRILPRLVSGSRQLRETKPDTREQLSIVQRHFLDAMREALGTERSIGAYSSETYRQVQGFLDTVEERFTTA